MAEPVDWGLIHELGHETKGANVRDIVKSLGFNYLAMPKDGECLFHCLGRLVGEPGPQIRGKVVQQLLDHPERYYWLCELEQVDDMPPYAVWMSEKDIFLIQCFLTVGELDFCVGFEPCFFRRG